MLFFYRFITRFCDRPLRILLQRRLAAGKEDPARLDERRGVASIKRPEGPLGYIHAASVGEAQSALILIDRLLQNDPDLHILVTTGTRTSAQLMAKKLPKRAFHQFYPLDHPRWVERFLDHWQPDFVIWMESELWPNMLGAIRVRNIPAALVNARLSDKSFRVWRLFKRTAKHILSAFTIILAQTDLDKERFEILGHASIHTTGNLKYSANALPCDDSALAKLQTDIGKRPVWVYASTHKGEETLACRAHKTLKKRYPDLLTILVPRHPERRADILEQCADEGLNLQLRGEEKAPITPDTDIYIADTLGELGLFYRLAPIAMIGRSLSDDGGGGHNPIEAAQLDCAVLYGKDVQYQQEIFNDMAASESALRVEDEDALTDILNKLLGDTEFCSLYQDKALKFAREKEGVIDRVWDALAPLVKEASS